jgi:hypothetical protein
VQGISDRNRCEESPAHTSRQPIAFQADGLERALQRGRDENGVSAYASVTAVENLGQILPPC